MAAAALPAWEIVEVEAGPGDNGQILVVGHTTGKDCRTFTVQCGYGSWNVCTVVVEASSAEEACALAIEDANDSLDWRELVSCSPTSVDAMAEGYQVDVWAEAGDGSKLPIPIAFGEHAEADILRLALWSLLAWAEQTGGCDAPCWTEARALFNEPRTRLEGEPAAARSDAQ